jgi:flagellar FliL protein
MTDTADPNDIASSKTSKLPLLIGLILAIAGGGGGFFAVKTGVIGSTAASDTGDTGRGEQTSETYTDDSIDIAFVALDPLVISLPGSNGRVLLRFAAQLEVSAAHTAEVEAIKPRIVDVLNEYLRAVDLEELEDPTALMRLRGQMLRRIQIVTGEDRVRDLLIMEFVLN